MKLTRSKISKLRHTKNQSYKSYVPRKKYNSNKGIRTFRNKNSDVVDFLSKTIRKYIVKYNKKAYVSGRRGGAVSPPPSVKKDQRGPPVSSLGPNIEGDIVLGEEVLTHQSNDTPNFIRNVLKKATQGKTVQINDGKTRFHRYTYMVSDGLLYGKLAPEGKCEFDDNEAGNKEFYFCKNESVGVCTKSVDTDLPEGAYIFIQNRVKKIDKSADDVEKVKVAVQSDKTDEGTKTEEVEYGQLFKLDGKNTEKKLNDDIFASFPTTAQNDIMGFRIKLVPETVIEPESSNKKESSSKNSTPYVYNFKKDGGDSITIYVTLKNILEIIRKNMDDDEDSDKLPSKEQLQILYDIIYKNNLDDEFKNRIYKFMYFYSATSPPNTTKQTLDKFKIGDYEAHKTLVTKIEKVLGVAQAGPGGPCERFPGTTNPELELLIKSTGDGSITAKLRNPNDLSVIGSVNTILDVIKQQNEEAAAAAAAADEADKKERQKEGQQEGKQKEGQEGNPIVVKGVLGIVKDYFNPNNNNNTLESPAYSTVVNNTNANMTVVENEVVTGVGKIIERDLNNLPQYQQSQQQAQQQNPQYQQQNPQYQQQYPQYQQQYQQNPQQYPPQNLTQYQQYPPQNPQQYPPQNLTQYPQPDLTANQTFKKMSKKERKNIYKGMTPI